ncbi:general stress protein CsbD [Flavobacterium sp. UBA6135]|uniref:general stress protein CsbD n=1 Tax=Flavobacterium sp. UBA6135 TaxID=1946553 RepID=UPI0025B7BCC4|nr:general stress protein CsbD [Flavobacterium sp. UBA6135]
MENVYLNKLASLKSPVKNNNWNNKKRILKAKFTSLTDADLRFDDGNKNAMLSKVQVRLGMTKDELSSLLASL